MGNYSTLYGRISVEIKNLEEYKKQFNKYFKNSSWEITFNKHYKITKLYKESDNVYLSFVPERNSFKLLGYPDNFDEYFSFYKANLKLIEFAQIIGDCEDNCMFLIELNNYENNQFLLKMFRTDEVTNNEHMSNWHESFINKIKK